MTSARKRQFALSLCAIALVTSLSIGTPLPAGNPAKDGAPIRQVLAQPAPGGIAGNSDRAGKFPQAAHPAPVVPAPVLATPPTPAPGAPQVQHSPGRAASALAANGIPDVALAAYRRAAQNSSCGLSWTMLAAIGRVESNHGRYGGSRLLRDGRTSRPVIGIPLDGRPGVALIRDTDQGRYDGDTMFDHAVGPMQFIPSTWRRYAADGNGDGIRDPHNIFDSALAAARYLCAGRAGGASAVYRYNHSNSYVSTVLSLASGYDQGGTRPTTEAAAALPAPPSTHSPTVPTTAQPRPAAKPSTTPSSPEPAPVSTPTSDQADPGKPSAGSASALPPTASTVTSTSR